MPWPMGCPRAAHPRSTPNLLRRPPSALGCQVVRLSGCQVGSRATAAANFGLARADFLEHGETRCGGGVDGGGGAHAAIAASLGRCREGRDTGAKGRHGYAVSFRMQVLETRPKKKVFCMHLLETRLQVCSCMRIPQIGSGLNPGRPVKRKWRHTPSPDRGIQFFFFFFFQNRFS